MRLLLNPNSHNHNQRDRRRRFSLAVLIGRRVGGVLLAVSARHFAKLRSRNSETNQPRERILRRFVAVDRGSRTCVMFARSTEARTQELRRLCSLFADPTQEGRQAHGSRSDVIMSGVVDSGQESRHGNIDANDSKRSL